jgi:hypothetical protein
MQDMLISAGFSYLISSIKNPKKKAKFRTAFLKLFGLIWAQFQNDEEFKEVVGVE